jgi:hypothetical protein
MRFDPRSKMMTVFAQDSHNLPDQAERDRLPHPLGEVRSVVREVEVWIP